MATINPQLRTALTHFANESGATAQEVAELRAAIIGDQSILAKLNENAAQGHLKGFSLAPPGSPSIGRYDAGNDIILLPREVFTGAPPANSDLRAVLRLQDMSLRFAQLPGVTVDIHDNLQRTINESPALVDRFKDAVRSDLDDSRHLMSFNLHTRGVAGGSYSPGKRSILGSLILFGAFALAACAHAPEAEAPATAPAPDPAATTPPPPPSAAEVTVENLLRWPLEGPAGVDKVRAGLQQVLQMRTLPVKYLTGDGPVQLADGFILTFASIQGFSDDISIGLEQEPCVSPTYAQQLIGAVQNPSIRDMHGVDRGKTYSTRRNGVWVTIRTTPVTYRCVTGISINPAKELNP